MNCQNIKKKPRKILTQMCRTNIKKNLKHFLGTTVIPNKEKHVTCSWIKKKIKIVCLILIIEDQTHVFIYKPSQNSTKPIAME